MKFSALNRFRNYRNGLIFLLILAILNFIACQHEPMVSLENEIIYNPDPNTDTVYFRINTSPCESETVYFTNQILPIYISNCAISGCHDAASAEEGVVLTNYQTITRKIRAGNPNDSEYYTVLLSGGEESDELMPRDPATGIGYSLPQEDIDLIRTWILQGAKNNYCDACDTTEYSFAGTIMPIIETNCATSSGCHGAGSMNSRFLSYDQIKPYAGNGLIENRVIVYKNMPPANPLPDCEMLLIKKWIDNGALNN